MKENTELANDSRTTDISSRDKQNIHAIVLKSNVQKNKLAYWDSESYYFGFFFN